jgi:hypothetical protein
MTEKIQAPRLVLTKNNRVMNADTNSPANGVAVFGPGPSASQPEEGPTTIMKRWSEFRQSPMPKAE